MTWHDQAACRGEDQAVMYPADTDHDTIRIALSLCGACPVTDPLLRRMAVDAARLPRARRLVRHHAGAAGAQPGRDPLVRRLRDTAVSRAGTRCRSCAQVRTAREVRV